jgi:hypothetical protein
VILIVWIMVEVMSVVDAAIELLSEVVFEPAPTVVDVFGEGGTVPDDDVEGNCGVVDDVLALEVPTAPAVVLRWRDVAAPETDEALTVVGGGAVGPGK